MGNIGLDGFSPANPQRVYALIEAEARRCRFPLRQRRQDLDEDELEERKLRQRAWYYGRISSADPKDPEKVYATLTSDFVARVMAAPGNLE